MFPEYRDLITQLKNKDAHFTRLFDEHNELDQKIQNIESHIEVATEAEIEQLKKQKLHLKDELYAILVKANQVLLLASGGWEQIIILRIEKPSAIA
jgi:uncharacterized protein YdcH (DUF465 family)